MIKYKNRYILGADIGGSHITAAVVDLETKEILRATYQREHLNTNGTVQEIIKSWSEVILKSIAISGEEVTEIGLALPGPFNYETGVSYIKDQGKYDNLYEVNVKEKLSTALNLPITNILFDNDAACFLRGEIFSGVADEGVDTIGITLGTGLGSSTAIKGEVRDAALWCTNFKDGIAEDYLVTRWFIKRYNLLTGREAKDVRQILQIATSGEIDLIFNEFGENLSDFLKLKIEEYSPKQILIGGNISKASTYFLPKLHSLHVPIKIASLGEESALLGAASLFIEN